MFSFISARWRGPANRHWASFILGTLGAGLVAMAARFGSHGLLAQEAAPQQTVELSESTSPIENFKYLWCTFDSNYALFAAKGVDWNALYKMYRPLVDENTSDDELFKIMSHMLGHLNDNHVNLFRGDTRFCAGVLNGMTMDDFSLDLIRKNYLREGHGEKLGGVFHFGRLTDKIGYFHFGSFRNVASSGAAVDQILAELADCEALVVDVRVNHGGDDKVGQAIANRFADRKRLYMTTAKRNGPRHEDFAPPKYWHVEPSGSQRFTKPVVLLTHRFSVSAADNFTLAMRVLPHVTHVGDFTSGCFADNYRDRLPNGWPFSVSFNLFLDHRGACWEGIGIAPDLVQRNSSDDLAAGHDRVLEFAIRLLESGPPAPRRETGSLEAVRPSLAAQLETTIRQRNIAKAEEVYQRARAKDFSGWAIDEEEFHDAAQRFSANRQWPAAIAEANWHAQAFSKSWLAEEGLGKVYAQSGDKPAAKEHYQRSLELNPRTYPWDCTGYDRVTARLKDLAEP